MLAPVLGCPSDTASTATVASVPAYKTAPAVPPPSAQQQQQQAQATQTAAANQHAQKVQSLIDRAEAGYASGVKNYNANRLDAARQDFDYAVDTLLASGMDLKNDPVLSDEFDRLLSAINSLEMFALKQGNGFSPAPEEAPLESVEDTTFASNPELVTRLKTELNTTSDLPLIINDQVAGYINVFAQSNSFRAHMSASMQRLGKYRTLIQNALREEGVPQDLIYLAVAESGFQAQVVNTRTGAGGMWQFMTYTSPEYSLTRNGYFDYRFDPEKSTHAYARYMKKLYDLFGDWYLAMAAYDWGPGNIQRVVSRTGYASFWELYRHNAMPGETRAYVPQILAAIIMAKNPEKYGLNQLPPSPPVIYETVTTDYSISLSLVADLTNSSLQEVVALNPALLRLSTPPDISYDLHLPPGTKDVFLDRVKDIPEDKRQSWRFHVVKNGETLDAIADALHAHSSEIASLNEVTAAHPIEVGDELIVPTAVISKPGTQRYTVRAHDTLVSIADRFGVTVDQLKEWNHLYSSRVPVGHALYVSEPIHLAPSSSRSRRSRSSSGGHTTTHHSSSTRAHASSTHHSTSGTTHHSTASTSSHSSTHKKNSSSK